jgi:agmatinase
MFDPSDIAKPNGNIFAFPDFGEDSDVFILPVEWDATTSYGKGAAKAPDAILKASMQLDFFDLDIENAWNTKITRLKPVKNDNKKIGKIADKVIKSLEKNAIPNDKLLKKVHNASLELSHKVSVEARKYLEKNKFIALLGGDHSCAFPFIDALSHFNEDFGVLHIDAHADLRKSYEGFEYSHASVMYNVITKIAHVSKLVQVALRDVSPDEYNFAKENPKIEQFYDRHISERRYAGETWQDICQEIVSKLPDNVYISFDIDGLSPENCPNTGTPVPGGLSFNEAVFLLKTLRKSGKKIIAFDLCEVSPDKNGDEWDANVGARILYQLCLNSCG